MIRLNIIVEGQTEETFLNRILSPHLAAFEVFVSARRVETGRKHHRIHRGGMTNYHKAKKDIGMWMKQDHRDEARFTTMFDLYRLPKDFPGIEEAKRNPDPYGKVRLLENRFGNDLESARFIPYIQLHEFETILLADPAGFNCYYLEHGPAVAALEEEIDGFVNPELIDDGKETAPSKRIIKYLPGYLKEKHVVGPLIAERIGLPNIRAKCAHFDEWLSSLERL